MALRSSWSLAGEIVLPLISKGHPDGTFLSHAVSKEWVWGQLDGGLALGIVLAPSEASGSSLVVLGYGFLGKL